MQTILTAQMPRVQCPTHGVRLVRAPWAEAGSRFTALFEALVIDWLHEASISAVASQMGLSWEEANGIMERAVARGERRRGPVSPEAIGVDETSFQKRHEYVTVVIDLKTSRVVYVADDRKKETLAEWFRSLGPRALANIKVVAMDMWPPYIEATREHVPGAEAKIVFDKYHVAAHLGGAMDQVRRSEHRVLMAMGDDRLKHLKHALLSNPDTLEQRPLREAVRQKLERVLAGKLQTARAHALKEAAMEIWDDENREVAKESWRWWYGRAIRSRLAPMKIVARMIMSHLEGILNAIVTGATNAATESVNARIQKIKRMACGFRNRARFRAAVLFHLGGLDLYPAAVTHSKA